MVENESTKQLLMESENETSENVIIEKTTNETFEQMVTDEIEDEISKKEGNKDFEKMIDNSVTETCKHITEKTENEYLEKVINRSEDECSKQVVTGTENENFAQVKTNTSNDCSKQAIAGIENNCSEQMVTETENEDCKQMLATATIDNESSDQVITRNENDCFQDMLGETKNKDFEQILIPHTFTEKNKNENSEQAITATENDSFEIMVIQTERKKFEEILAQDLLNEKTKNETEQAITGTENVCSEQMVIETERKNFEEILVQDTLNEKNKNESYEQSIVRTENDCSEKMVIEITEHENFKQMSVPEITAEEHKNDTEEQVITRTKNDNSEQMISQTEKENFKQKLTSDESAENTKTESSEEMIIESKSEDLKIASNDNDIFEVKNSLKNELSDENIFEEVKTWPNVVNYIQKLQKKILSQKRHIEELECQITRMSKNENQHEQSEKEVQKKCQKFFVDASIQTEKDDKENKVIIENKEWADNNQEKGVSIVDQVKEAAEIAMLQTGFVFEETTGLYYDYKSGYYYDSKSGLYYNGNTGTYYSYDTESNCYKFHSQLSKETKEYATESSCTEKETQNKASKKRKLDDDEIMVEDLEEGECSESSNSVQSIKEEIVISSESDLEDSQDYSKKHPPCIRMIVKETNSTSVKVGSLFIVTCIGGTVGREGDHCVLIPDINISKYHAKFQYNENTRKYEIIDLGSRNGTYIKGKRISVAKQESEPHEIHHASVLQLGCTKLLCHVHDGNDTCDDCEPGLVQPDIITVDLENQTSIKQQHKSELKRLKSKFGIKKSNTEAASQVAEGYQDRAQARRQTVGSINHNSKTEQSSLDKHIPKSNVGFKMLSKMGWSEGESLGKIGDGATEPVQVVANVGKSGLGDPSNIVIQVDSETEKRQLIWKKTQLRFKDISK